MVTKDFGQVFDIWVLLHFGFDSVTPVTVSAVCIYDHMLLLNNFISFQYCIIFYTFKQQCQSIVLI